MKDFHNINLGKVIKKYNGNFSGTYKSIDGRYYITVHLCKNRPTLPPFIYKNVNIITTSVYRGIISVEFKQDE